MNAPSRERSTNDGDDGRSDQSFLSSDLISQRAAAEGSNAGSKEEQGVNSAEDMIGIGSSRASRREVEVFEETRLPDTGGE